MDGPRDDHTKWSHLLLQASSRAGWSVTGQTSYHSRPAKWGALLKISQWPERELTGSSRSWTPHPRADQLCPLSWQKGQKQREQNQGALWAMSLSWTWKASCQDSYLHASSQSSLTFLSPKWQGNSQASTWVSVDWLEWKLVNIILGGVGVGQRAGVSYSCETSKELLSSNFKCIFLLAIIGNGQIFDVVHCLFLPLRIYSLSRTYQLFLLMDWREFLNFFCFCLSGNLCLESLFTCP